MDLHDKFSGSKGLRYGENPGQDAALYKQVNGNLLLGEIRTLAPGKHLASDIELLQSGKHPGKTNLPDRGLKTRWKSSRSRGAVIPTCISRPR